MSRPVPHLLRVSRKATALSCLPACLAIVSVIACGSGGDDDDNTGTGGTSSNAGRGGGGGRPQTGGGSGGKSASGFACPSEAEPGDMTSVPAGDFLMGCNEEVDDECEDDERPLHTVSLSAFEIDETEVTQEQYAACVTAGECPEPECEWDCERTEYPASCVTFAAANTYCAWAGKRLPTEAEWEKAARGEDGAKYPWGNDEPTCELTNMAGCGEAALPVGSAPDGASPYGALDMSGNMVEFVSDWYSATYYQTSPSADPQGPETGTRFGGRGGGFRSDAEYQRASKRDYYDPPDQGAALGFRCAR
jgi:formylglycine-generating enzyme required for sulfatase activity